MKKSNITLYQCDECKKEVQGDAYEMPEGWIWFSKYSSYNYLTVSFRHHDKDVEFEVDISKGIFCSPKCLADALFSEVLENHAAEIVEANREEAETKVVLNDEPQRMVG